MPGSPDDRPPRSPPAGDEVAVDWDELGEAELAVLSHGPLHERLAILRRVWPVISPPPAPLTALRPMVEQDEALPDPSRAGMILLGAAGLGVAGILVVAVDESWVGLMALAVLLTTAMLMSTTGRDGDGRRERLAADRIRAVAALRRHAFVHRGRGTRVVHLAVPRSELQAAARRLQDAARSLGEVRAELDAAQRIRAEAAALPAALPASFPKSFLDGAPGIGLEEHRTTLQRLAADRHLLSEQVENRLATLVLPEGDAPLSLDLSPLLDGVDALVMEVDTLRLEVMPADASPLGQPFR